MKTRSVICRGQVRTIEDAIEAWKAGHEDAMEVRDIEDVIPVCLMLGELLQQWQKDAWESLFSNRLREVQSAGALLQKAYSQSLEAFEGVADCLRWAKRNGYAVEKATDFQRIAEMVQRLHADFARRWPFLDPTAIDEARAQISRGEFVSEEDIQHELHVVPQSSFVEANPCSAASDRS
jgi:hypothetical protein